MSNSVQFQFVRFEEHVVHFLRRLDGNVESVTLSKKAVYEDLVTSGLYVEHLEQVPFDHHKKMCSFGEGSLGFTVVLDPL